MKALLYLLFSIIAQSSLAQLIHDESYADESFWKFKVELENCIIKKDSDKLKSMMADTVFHSIHVCDHPGCSREELIDMLFNNDYADQAWEEMLLIVRYGFYQDTSKYKSFPILYDSVVFMAPSFHKYLNEDKEVLILGTDVNIREQPSVNATVIKRSTFEKYACDCNIIDLKETTSTHADGLDWLEIYLENGSVGYVATKYTSYYYSNRFEISKVNGKWKIISYFHPPGC